MRTKQKNRIRKSTKYIGSIISIVLLVTSFISLMQNVSNENIKTRTKEIYNYTNKFNYDYNVNLINNKYIEQDEQKDESIVYVTDLIDTTDLNINYEYLADKESDLKYRGASKVIHIKATKTIEDFFIHDIDGIVNFLKIQKPKILKGSTGLEKLEKLFLKGNRIYQKGHKCSGFIDSLDMNIILPHICNELKPLCTQLGIESNCTCCKKHVSK